MTPNVDSDSETLTPITTIDDPPDELLLNDIWSFYFHDPYDNSWTYDSYKKLCTITSAEEFWGISSLLGDKIQHGMFFLMREHVFPCWDDENNKAGGCLSIKVLKSDMLAFWEELCVKILCENLVDEKQRHLWSYLNGISTSPKKHFCIIKLWVRTPDLAMSKFFTLPKNYHGDVIYRSNQESIDYDHMKSKHG